MSALTYVPLEARGVLTVEGADAEPFLQDIISNDITKANERSAIYAALLTPQGKFLHDFLIAVLGYAYLLDCEGPRLMDLGQRLLTYKLRADVALADASDDFCVVALIGDGAGEALALHEGRGAAKPWAGGVVFRDPRTDGLGARAVLPRDDDLGAIEQAGFVRGEVADYERLRLSLGVPDGSRDMAVEKATLLENDFEALHGVDFAKGCYVGQELTARTKHRGLVRRRLTRVAVDGPLPPPGTPITADGRETGEMRTGLDGQALALLRLDRVEQAAEAGTPLMAGDARITPVHDEG